MKKVLSIILALSLTLALCACGAKTTASPAASASPSPSEEVVTSELTTYLGSIKTDYQQGVAGCSLNAAKLAGELMDWYIASKPSADAITAETSAFFKTLGSDTADYTSKMGDICGAAMQTCGSDGADLLSSAGYTPKGTWTFDDANTLFGAIYAGMDLPMASYIPVYSSDDQAEHFVINYVSVDELTADNVLAALVNAGVVAENVTVEDFKTSGSALTLDLSADFQKQLSALGTSGEYMLMGSVVNTFLAAFGGKTITITAAGKTITTGHNEYSQPLTQYADNTAKK
jgi:hypothetical protein